MDNKTFFETFKKRLYAFTVELLKAIDTLPKDNVSRRLGDQLIRSGTSIIANFVEGRAASSKKDFINYLNIALKSANESKLWISLLKDTNKLKSDTSEKLQKELKELSNILAKSIITLRNK